MHIQLFAPGAPWRLAAAPHAPRQLAHQRRERVVAHREQHHVGAREPERPLAHREREAARNALPAPAVHADHPEARALERERQTEPGAAGPDDPDGYGRAARAGASAAASVNSSAGERARAARRVAVASTLSSTESRSTSPARPKTNRAVWSASCVSMNGQVALIVAWSSCTPRWCSSARNCSFM